MTQAILAALAKLEPENNNHWTSDGLPRLESVRLFTGMPNLSREAVTTAAPLFNRASLVLPRAGSQDPGTDAPTVSDPVAPQPGANPEGTQNGAGNPDNLEDDGGDESGFGFADPQTQPSSAPAEDALKAAQAAHDSARLAKEKADQEYAQATRALDIALVAHAKANPSQQLHSAVQSYHARQLQLMGERAKQSVTLRTAGVNVADLVALLPKRAPIDQALQRNTKRGRQRPTTLVPKI
jgi:hypothetical protein